MDGMRDRLLICAARCHVPHSAPLCLCHVCDDVSSPVPSHVVEGVLRSAPADQYDGTTDLHGGRRTVHVPGDDELRSRDGLQDRLSLRESARPELQLHRTIPLVPLQDLPFQEPMHISWILGRVYPEHIALPFLFDDVAEGHPNVPRRQRVDSVAPEQDDRRCVAGSDRLERPQQTDRCLGNGIERQRDEERGDEG